MHSMQNTKSLVSRYEELVFAITITLPEFTIGQEEGGSIANEGGKCLVVEAYWLLEVTKPLFNKLDSVVAS